MCAQVSPTPHSTYRSPSPTNQGCRRKWSQLEESIDEQTSPQSRNTFKRARTSARHENATVSISTTSSDTTQLVDDIQEHTNDVNSPILQEANVFTIYPPSFLTSSMPTSTKDAIPMSTRFIDLPPKFQDVNNNEGSRIVDLSTGEVLEIIPSLETQQKRKRTLDQIVDNFEEETQTIMWALQTGEVDPVFLNEETLNTIRPPNKKVKSASQPTSNFIEEVDYEENEPSIFPPTIDIMQDLKLRNTGNIATCATIPSNSSAVVHGNTTAKFKFTIPYQKAFANYMRSQIAQLKYEGLNDKQVILFGSSKSKLLQRLWQMSKGCQDVKGKIYEITEETRGEGQMLVDDVQPCPSKPIEISAEVDMDEESDQPMNASDKKMAKALITDDQDEMDIDS